MDEQLNLFEDKVQHIPDYIYGELFERIKFNIVTVELFTVEHFG